MKKYPDNYDANFYVYKQLIKFLWRIFNFINNIFLNNYYNFFYFTPLIFASSIIFYLSLSQEVSWSFYFIGICGFILSLGGYFYAKKLNYGVLIKSLTGFYNIFFLAFCFIAYRTHHLPPLPALPHEAIWIEGDVIDQRILPHFGSDLFHQNSSSEEVTLKNIRYISPFYERSYPSPRYSYIRLKGGIQNSEDDRLLIGDTIKIRVLFHQILPSFWVYGRNFQREAYFSNFMGRGVALSFPKIIQKKKNLLRISERWRAFRLSHARKIMHWIPGQEGAVMATLLFGDTERISSQTRKDFSASGLSHLLAVAGLHLGIVLSVIYAVSRFILLRLEWMILHRYVSFWASCSALLCGTLYIAFTGFHIPALRALGGVSFFLLGMSLYREPIPLRLLTLMALFLEIIDPVIILDISFQMSFAAVMCILAALARQKVSLKKNSWVEIVIETIPWGLCRKIVHYFSLTIKLSCLAALPTIPLAMAYFGAFQPYFLIANLVAIPLMSFLVMPCALLGLVFWMVGLGKYFFLLAGKGIGLILCVAHWVQSLPFSSYEVPSFPSWGIFLYFIGLSFFCLWNGRERFLGLFLIFVACLSPWCIERPVIFIAPDHNLIGIREGRKILIGPHKDPAIAAQWSKDMALSLGTLSDKCPQKEGFCRLSFSHKIILLYLGARFPERQSEEERARLCKDVALYISLASSRPICGAVPMIDKKAILADGAWNIYDHKGFYLLSDREVHGARPWIAKRWAEGEQGLPLAKEE